MTRWEINFTPAKRYVRGEHQPDVSYLLPANTLGEARAAAINWLRADRHDGYKFHSARQVAGGDS